MPELSKRVSLEYSNAGPDGVDLHGEAKAWFAEVADKLGLTFDERTMDLHGELLLPGLWQLTASVELYPP